jgi:hypothetical protein
MPNSNPSTANKTIKFNEDSIYTFKNDDFQFIDSDSGDVGGGIFNSGNLTASNTTILQNTIVASNTNVSSPDAAGSYFDRGNNLIGNNTGSYSISVNGFTASTLIGTNATPINPLLGALADWIEYSDNSNDRDY